EREGRRGAARHDGAEPGEDGVEDARVRDADAALERRERVTGQREVIHVRELRHEGEGAGPRADARRVGGGAVLEQRRGGGARGRVRVERAGGGEVRDRKGDRALVQVLHEGVEDRQVRRDGERLVRGVRYHLVAEVLHLDHVARGAGGRIEPKPRRAPSGGRVAARR